MNTQVVFGLVGLIASGKGAVAEYLADRHGAKVFKFSNVLRDVLDRIYIDQTRENITMLSEALRERFGEDILAQTLAKDVAHMTEPIIVVDGFRRLEDLFYFSELPNFVLIDITADPRIRYERMIGRGENPGEEVKSFEQFLKDHESLSTEKTIPHVQKKAQERIENNGTYEELIEKVDALVKKYTK